VHLSEILRWQYTVKFMIIVVMLSGEWRKLHNEELSDLYSFPNILRVVKSRRMRWAGHVARVGEGCTVFWWGNLRERDH